MPMAILQSSSTQNDLVGAFCDLGLVTGGDDWEYPLWALLGRDGAPLLIEHVRVTNESRFARAVPRDHAPCVVVGIGVPRLEPVVLRGRTFRPVLADGPVQVLAS